MARALYYQHHHLTGRYFLWGARVLRHREEDKCSFCSSSLFSGMKGKDQHSFCSSSLPCRTSFLLRKNSIKILICTIFLLPNYEVQTCMPLCRSTVCHYSSCHYTGRLLGLVDINFMYMHFSHSVY